MLRKIEPIGEAMNHSCPDCRSTAFKKNGYTRHGKQNHRCLDCGRQFSLEIEEVSSLLLQESNNNSEVFVNEVPCYKAAVSSA